MVQQSIQRFALAFIGLLAIKVGSRIGSPGLFEVCVNWLELSKT